MRTSRITIVASPFCCRAGRLVLWGLLFLVVLLGLGACGGGTVPLGGFPDDDDHDYPRVVTASCWPKSTITARFSTSRAFLLEEDSGLRTEDLVKAQ